MITFGFRFDDPASNSDHALEQKIIELFSKYAANVCFAVIPFKGETNDVPPLQAQDIPHILAADKANAVEIALHGYSHFERGQTDSGAPSEFAGIAINEQTSLISKGLAHLQQVLGHTVAGFVPPFNTYDLNTLKAADSAGLQYLSAGWETPVGWKSAHQAMVPRSCTLGNVDSALSEAEQWSSFNPVVVVVMHHYDFKEYVNADPASSHPPITDLNKLEQFLVTLSHNSDVSFSSLTDIVAMLGGQSGCRHIDYQQWHQRQHWRIKSRLPGKLLMSASPVRVLVGGLRRSFFSV